MATTTTNYGFDIPQSTDLVKDGATAIATLGQDIDTAMNTALGTKKAGMVLLNTTSFSGVASQSINNVFSATYDVYRVNLVFVASAGNTVNLRLRVGGSDNSTASSYTTTFIQGTGGSATASDVVDTAAPIVNGNTNRAMASFDIAQPFVAATTVLTGTGGRTDRVRSIFAHHNQSVSYDGFTVFGDGGSTITGYVQIFGYNK